ncbi:MAG: hypothetical protein KDD11_06000 [Acidobacteria bacterium]|nr:hypothetical protein [Acidobacteriota bacterium]
MKNILLILLFSCLGCGMVSTLPASGGSAGVGDARAFGRWSTTEVMGAPVTNPTQIEVTDTGERSVQLDVTASGETSVISGVYISIGSLQVLSVQNDQDSWNILFLEFSADGQVLTVRAMDVDVVRTAVEEGQLVGEVILPDTSEMLISVGAASPELVDFIAATPTAVGTVVGILSKE